MKSTFLDDDSKYSEQEGWIQWFCSLDDFNILCEVDPEYIKDGFNLYGIRERFSRFEYKIVSNNLIKLVKPLK